MSAERFPGLTVRLPLRLRERVIAHCIAGLPLEACGLLLGGRDDDLASVVEIMPARNVRASPSRYEIAPEVVLEASRTARASGHVLLGAWHSHPGARAVPSAIDRAEAWPDWCYLIVGLADPAAPELRSWRLLGEDFVEDLLEFR